MSKKKSPSRLGSNIPATRGLSTLFGGAVAEQTVIFESDVIQEVAFTAETSNASPIPDKNVIEKTHAPEVTASLPATHVAPVIPDADGTSTTKKVPKKKKSGKVPPPPIANVGIGGAEFTPTRGLPLGWERHTYVIQTKLVELIEAAAYWARQDKKEILQAALEMYFTGRKIKPLPLEKRRDRKPRATTKK
jgi:hypothetical protein